MIFLFAFFRLFFSRRIRFSSLSTEDINFRNLGHNLVIKVLIGRSSLKVFNFLYRCLFYFFLTLAFFLLSMCQEVNMVENIILGIISLACIFNNKTLNIIVKSSLISSSIFSQIFKILLFHPLPPPSSPISVLLIFSFSFVILIKLIRDSVKHADLAIQISACICQVAIQIHVQI